MTMRTVSNGTPSRSATTWAKTVSCPWPCDWLPIGTSTIPVGSTRTSAYSRGTPPVPSTYGPMPMPRSLPRRAESSRRSGKPGDVGELERLVEARDVVTGVVDGAGGRPIGERPDHVEAPQGDAIAAGLARGALDQPLDGVDALEAADAAIHVDRHGVGEGALEPQMNRGDGVEPGHHALHVQDDRDRHPRRDVGAEVLRRMHAEGGDVTAGIEGQLTREHVIARLGVGEEALGPARHPLDAAGRGGAPPTRGRRIRDRAGSSSRSRHRRRPSRSARARWGRGGCARG